MKRIHRLMILVFGLLLSLAGSALAGDRIEKNLKLDPGGTLSMDTGGGDIIVRGDSASGAHVVVTSNVADLAEVYDLQFEEAAHAVRITAHRRSAFDWPHHFSLKFEISVPRQTSLELKTGGGDVRTQDLDGAVQLRTSGGDVNVSEVKGDVNAETSGGDMEVRQLTGNLVLRTSGGDIKARGISGRVDVHSAGGDVEVSLVPGNAHGGEIGTSGGEVTVALDPQVNLDLEASAGGGDVESGLAITINSQSHSNLRATMGKGGELLRLSTTGGDIRLRAL